MKCKLQKSYKNNQFFIKNWTSYNKSKKTTKKCFKKLKQRIEKNSPWTLFGAPSSELLDKPCFESLKIHSKRL
jgi:hypothetical protein